MKHLNIETDPSNKPYSVVGHNHILGDINGVVADATPNSLLILDSNGKLPASITGDSATVGGQTKDILSPPGMIMYYPKSTPPTGWLKANGALISRTTYAALFAIIGTTFGVGDGSTTFALPDLRGEFIRGFDDARGVDTGRTIGSTQAQDTQPHTHNYYRVSSLSTTYNYPRNSYMGNASPTLAGATSSFGTKETRPRNIALLCCIKY